MEEDSPDAIRTRPSLIRDLAESDARWPEFDGMYRKLIWNAVIRAGVARDEADDVTQETLFTLWKQIRQNNFRYDRTKGSFRGFVKQTTRFRIADYYRKKSKRPQVPAGSPGTESDSTGTTNRIPDPR